MLRTQSHTAAELLTILSARQLKDGQVVFAGVGIPLLAAIPPAADLCCAAAKARRAVVHLDSQSLVAESLVHAATLIAAAVDDERGKLRGFSKLHP